MESIIQKQFELAHISHTPVRFEDLDSTNHVCHSAYFVYIEQARIEWLQALDRAKNPLIESIDCSFIEPITYPGTVETRLYVNFANKTTAETRYEICMQDHQQIFAIGNSRISWIDL